MKITVLNSTLSCIHKCIRFCTAMINKKKIFGLIFFGFLTACSTPTTMLGPAYTLTSTGSAIQAGLNYGSNQLVTMYTGKTPIENLQEISSKKQIKTKNIQKETLESEDFYHLVKNKFEKTSKILKNSNQ